MNCPNCAASMTHMMLQGHQGLSIDVDVCHPCQSLWFDKHESLKLSPASTLKLMRLIGEHSARAHPQSSSTLVCPRCYGRLVPTQDLQRSTRFNYWRCGNRDGRFIRFFDFLKEKDFIRPLSPRQIEELRQHVQSINCSNCGAPIDLAASSACRHCQSPLSMLDVKQSQEMLKQIEKGSAPRQVNPALPLELAWVKRDMDAAFAGLEIDDWWNEAAASGLVQAGLGAVAKWLSRAGF